MVADDHTAVDEQSCPECDKEGTYKEIGRHLRDDHNLENAKMNGLVEIQYCPHCGSDDILVRRGENTTDVCINCFDCGKFIWVRSLDPDDPAIDRLNSTAPGQ